MLVTIIVLFKISENNIMLVKKKMIFIIKTIQN